MYLGTYASSVHVESLFSTAGPLLNRKRSSLTPDKLNVIVFIHDNFEWIVEAAANDTLLKTVTVQLHLLQSHCQLKLLKALRLAGPSWEL